MASVPTLSIVNAMSSSRIPSGLVALIAGATCAMSACPDRTLPPPSDPIDAIAQRFVHALGEETGDALLGWFRSDWPIALRRHCPACPPERRVLSASLWTPADVVSLGTGLHRGDGADADATVSRLRYETVQCDVRCCTWSIGLLDHRAAHLKGACFDRDDRGPFVVSLELIDG